jgi:hypothetical protein
MASNVLSDLLFLAATIVFLIMTTNFIETPSRKNLITLGLLCAVSPLLRYAGLTYVLTVSLIILIQHRKDFFKVVLQAGAFGFLTSLPTILWVYFHNYLQTGILFGVRLPPNPLGNLEVTIEKAVHWFIPYSVTERIPEWIIISLLLAIFFTGNRFENWKNFGKQLVSAKFLPNLIFLIFYVSVLIFNVSYSEVRWPFMDRIHIIILPSLMAIGFLMVKELTPSYLRKVPPHILQSTAIVVFIVWLAYPLNNLQKTLRSALQNGETSEYNIYNTRAQSESGIKEFVASLNITSADKVYSNYEPVAWLYARHTIQKLPQGPVRPEKPNPDDVLVNYPDWPGADGGGYVIWMKQLGFKEYVLSPDQLTSKADFKLLFSSKQGDVYRITPK